MSCSSIIYHLMSWVFIASNCFNPQSAELICKNIATKEIFQFEIIIIVLFSFSYSFEYLCYGSTAIRFFFPCSYSAGIDFSRQNLTSTDVRFWRLKSIAAL